MDQWVQYLIGLGGPATAGALLRWLYALLVKGLGDENRRLRDRLTTQEAEIETYRTRAFAAEEKARGTSTGGQP